MELSVKSADGTAEVYVAQIFALADEFVSSLPDEKDVYDPYTWRALLQRIYTKLFKPESTMLYNCRTVLDLDDVQTLERLWDSYATLAYSYRHTPFLGGFGLMIGVSATTFSNWSSEATRSNTLSHFRAVKRWKAEAESTLEELVASKNQIGGIFLLKAAFGWKESTIDTPMIEETIRATPEQIAERYRDATKPEPPDLSMFDD